MLRDLIDNKKIEARGVIGFYPCNAVDHDDIQIYKDQD